jgi:hypothetical protein
MKRIALISIFTAAAALFGVVKPSSAETTVPMEDLALVSETASPGEPLVADAEPAIPPRFQYSRSQYPRFQSPRFQSPRFQSPRFQSPRFHSPRFQSPRFQSPRFHSPRFQYPHRGI